MSESKIPVPKFEPISEEELLRISGGDCTLEDVSTFLGKLQENYNTLVDFTSYVIERVVTSATN